jgi:hypothetical protein
MTTSVNERRTEEHNTSIKQYFIVNSPNDSYDGCFILPYYVGHYPVWGAVSATSSVDFRYTDRLLFSFEIIIS